MPHMRTDTEMSPISFPLGSGMFDEHKIAQAAAYFLSREGGRMAHLKLMKLLYLADRESIKRYGQPISGDEYYSLPHGPVLSKTLDLASGSAESIPGGWETWISDKENHEVALRCDASREALNDLSNADIDVLSTVWTQFGAMGRYQIRDYTHDKRHIPEWEDPKGSARPIPFERILKAVGRSDTQIEQDLDSLQSQRKINAVFASL